MIHYNTMIHIVAYSRYNDDVYSSFVHFLYWGGDISMLKKYYL
jgi:hypothetical protein